MGKQAKAVEQSNQTEEFICNNTKAKGALFNVDEVKENGPVMTGSMEIAGVKYPLSGFIKIAESQLRYMSLSVTSPLPSDYTDDDIANQVHYYGKLFRQENKRYHSSPDYTGFLTVLPCTGSAKHENDVWADAPTLQISGWKKRSADTSSRISLLVAPVHVADDELNY